MLLNNLRYKIVNFLLREVKDHKMRHKRLTLTDIDSYVSEDILSRAEAPSADRIALTRALFESATEKQKQYLVMYFKQKMTMEQIALRCGVAKSTVSRTIARGRNNIIRAMKTHELISSLEKRSRED